MGTLLKLSAAFDTALNVRFGSFTDFFRQAWSSKREVLGVPSFDEEAEEVGFVRTYRGSTYLVNAAPTSPTILQALLSSTSDPVVWGKEVASQSPLEFVQIVTEK